MCCTGGWGRPREGQEAWRGLGRSELTAKARPLGLEVGWGGSSVEV